MKILTRFFLLFALISPNFVFSSDNIQNDMLPQTNTIMGNSAEITGNGNIMTVLTEFKTIIFSLLAIIAVAVFIYLGFKLVTAQGKPDEFKKAMMGFVYAVIGIAIIPLAWAMVKLISSLQF